MPERLSKLIARFNYAYLGIGLIHAWLQLVFYGGYRQTDGSYFSTVMNLIRGLGMIAGALICYALYKHAQNKEVQESCLSLKQKDVLVLGTYLVMALASLVMAASYCCSFEGLYYIGGLIAACAVS